jgi:hypothetical protein
MESVRVDICYRPLRIGWAIRAGDKDAFRAATRLSFALWGGRFNPIIIVDHRDEAESLIDVFRVDVILPIGDSEDVKGFVKRFPYLIKPFHSESVFIGDGEGGARSQVLDIHNLISHLHRKPEWKALKEQGVRLYTWAADDPLADIFLMQFGDYPKPDEILIHYRDLLRDASEATEVKIDPAAKLPVDVFDHPSIAFMSRCGLQRHYAVRAGWDAPGFFSGDAQNLDDLVCCWNLRAADIPVLFVDPKHLDRYEEALASWDKTMREMVSHRRHEFERRLAVWVREESLNGRTPEAMTEVLKPFGTRASTICSVGDGSWNGLNIRPPMMHFGRVSTLGVMSTESGKPKVSFALNEKPFDGDSWFHTQHLVASVSFIGGLYGDEDHTLTPPYIPELNEFYARTMHFHYDKLRSESETVGLVIDSADTSSFVYAMPVADLVEKLFGLAGFSAKLSAGGLIARQLIAQLGGVDGARVFKIAGVRRLLKTHGPTAAFTKKSALELIGGKDPENPSSSFKEFEGLFIEPRDWNSKLKPEAVFTYLVDKGLFRMGSELTCPNCRMSSWTALDVLKQRIVCELCGREFDATRQLVNGVWHYRRSGVMGAERNAQGAIPVVLTLQQFKTNMGGLFHSAMYSPSLDLEPKPATDLPKCEVDFVWLIPESYPDKTVVVIGECKDRGGKTERGKDTGTIDAKDIDHLKRVADAFPRKRFETYIVLAKLCPFTAEEIALAKTLNDKYRRRAVLLTARELEPYHFFERTKLEFANINEYASRLEDLAAATAEMYFN